MMTQTHSNRSRKTPPATAPAIIGVPVLLFMPFVSSVTAGSVLVPTLLPGLVGRPFGGGILVLAVKVALVVLAMGELVSAMKVALVVV